MDKELKDNSLNEEEINTDIKSSTLNQNFEQTKKKKTSKYGQNYKSTIPLDDAFNIPLTSNSNAYNVLNDDIREIINDSKYNNQKRSKSSYNHKIIIEKNEISDIPELENWNLNSTAKIIIHCLEQKIDALMYENNLLKRRLRALFRNNKDLQFDLTDKKYFLNTEKQIYDENLQKLLKDKNIRIEKNEKYDELYKEIMKLKNENKKLRRKNDILSEDNLGLKKIIKELNNNKKLIQIKFNEEIQKYKKILKSINYNIKEINIEKNNKTSIDKNNYMNINNQSIDNELNESYNYEKTNKRNAKTNINFDMDEYIINRGDYVDLFDENEKLHQKLKNLLSIDEDEIYKLSDSVPQNKKKVIYKKNINIKSMEKKNK